jgi:DNA-3-methyladenine glycosylase II
MAAIIADYPGEILSGRGDAFYTLARSITGQQISVVVADAVWGRLEQAMPEMATITPQAVTSLTDEQLRTMGYSRQKISYLRSLADFFLQREQPEQDWQRMEDEQVIQDLIQIRGIGRWSAEMFLIFHLQRPDILPLDDIGLLKAIGRHYGTGEKASRKQARTTAQGWKPWRSVATWYLWRSLDPVPVAY